MSIKQNAHVSRTTITTDGMAKHLFIFLEPRVIEEVPTSDDIGIFKDVVKIQTNT